MDSAWLGLDLIHLSETCVAEIAKSTNLKGCPHTFVNIVNNNKMDGSAVDCPIKKQLSIMACSEASCLCKCSDVVPLDYAPPCQIMQQGPIQM